MRFSLCIARRATTPLRLMLAPIIALVAVTLAIPLVTADARRYAIQTEASELGFRATSRLMNADGRFHRFRGDVAVDPRDLATARISLSIEAASIDTGIGLRDKHLRSADFFDVERFPTITFESLRVEAAGAAPPSPAASRCGASRARSPCPSTSPCRTWPWSRAASSS